MKKMECNGLAAGYAAAIVSAALMLLLGIGWNVGVYKSAAEQMAKWHLFFTPSVGGIVAGMVEAAVISFVIAYLFVWTYNKFK
ncbi:MAG: hypothetical protein Q8Q01_01730 [archaeon]|nr:hypothetical protein [archaeon]